MAATVKAILRKDKKRADGTCPVHIRVIANRRSRQMSTKVYIQPRDWNENKQRVRSGHDLADAYNARIGTVLNEARAVALSASSSREVVQSLKKGAGAVVSDLDSFLAELTQRGQEWERKKYGVLRGKLVDCFGAELTWEQLDRKALIQFEEYLRDGRGNQPNTIRNEMKRLRRLFRRALVDGSVRPDQDPFLGYSPPRPVEARRRRLSRGEFEALEQIELEWGTGIRVARDAFVFATYCGGIRFGDLCTLTASNLVGDRLDYRMSKTQRGVSMKIPARASQLIQDYARQANPYLFPILGRPDLDLAESALKRRISARLVSINRNIKKVAARAGIERPEELTSHIARHTFAELARKRGVPQHETGMTMRHANTKETIGYQKDYDPDTVDGVLDAVWDSPR